MDNEKILADLNRGVIKADETNLTTFDAKSINATRIAAVSPLEYSSITLKVPNGKEVIHIDCDGDLFWNGKKVEAEKEFVQALSSFLREAGRL